MLYAEMATQRKTPGGPRQGAAPNEPVARGKQPLLALSRAAASLGPAGVGEELSPAGCWGGWLGQAGARRKQSWLLQALVHVICISTAPSSAS